MHPIDQITLILRAVMVALGAIYGVRFAVALYSFMEANY